jgi:hypothetical protein
LIKWDILIREKSMWKGILPKGYIKFTIGVPFSTKAAREPA